MAVNTSHIGHSSHPAYCFKSLGIISLFSLIQDQKFANEQCNENRINPFPWCYNHLGAWLRTNKEVIPFDLKKYGGKAEWL